MEGFLLRVVFNSVAIFLTTRVIHGLSIPDFTTAIVAALVLGLVNAFIRPIVLLLTLPLNVVTLGLLTLVINGLMLYLVAAVVPNFQIMSFWAAVFGALLIAIISTLLSHLVTGA